MIVCYRCKCWKWEKSSYNTNFPTFIPKGKIIKLIKKMKEKYKRNVDSGKLEFSKGPRYALVSNFSWNSVLSIEQAVKFSFNAKRQVTRATQIYIRGGKEHKSFSSDFRAKHFKPRT